MQVRDDARRAASRRPPGSATGLLRTARRRCWADNHRGARAPTLAAMIAASPARVAANETQYRPAGVSDRQAPATSAPNRLFERGPFRGATRRGQNTSALCQWPSTDEARRRGGSKWSSGLAVMPRLNSMGPRHPGVRNLAPLRHTPMQADKFEAPRRAPPRSCLRAAKTPVSQRLGVQNVHPNEALEDVDCLTANTHSPFAPKAAVG